MCNAGKLEGRATENKAWIEGSLEKRSYRTVFPECRSTIWDRGKQK
jgi:hypothetical protein